MEFKYIFQLPESNNLGIILIHFRNQQNKCSFKSHKQAKKFQKNPFLTLKEALEYFRGMVFADF